MVGIGPSQLEAVVRLQVTDVRCAGRASWMVASTLRMRRAMMRQWSDEVWRPRERIKAVQIVTSMTRVVMMLLVCGVRSFNT